MQATITSTLDAEAGSAPVNSRSKVVVASLIGTAIEFFDFYIYATAAVLIFPHIFFPQGDPTAATLQSLATFAIAFVARPIGSALFGHFGDRVGRKVTLVASLLTMGISTVLIGLLLSWLLSEEQFMTWGWRVPFVASAVLVLIGLYVRVSLHEAPVFTKAIEAGKKVRIPLGTLLSKHLKATILGTLIMLATYYAVLHHDGLFHDLWHLANPQRAGFLA